MVDAAGKADVPQLVQAPSASSGEHAGEVVWNGETWLIGFCRESLGAYRIRQSDSTQSKEWTGRWQRPSDSKDWDEPFAVWPASGENQHDYARMPGLTNAEIAEVARTLRLKAISFQDHEWDPKGGASESPKTSKRKPKPATAAAEPQVEFVQGPWPQPGQTTKFWEGTSRGGSNLFVRMRPDKMLATGNRLFYISLYSKGWLGNQEQ